MTFFVERFDGTKWTALMISPHQIGPSSITGPQESYPPSESPGGAPAFAGLPGWQARVRFDDDVLETFNWEKVPRNPGDPESGTVWGWRSIARNYKPLPVDAIAGPLSFMG